VTNSLGFVIIGRNEGERLRRCLQSIAAGGCPTVYVDSGSSDDSVALARSCGADVVELDRTRPFTPGRARNAGFARLRERAPSLAYVQFVDGDCEIAPDWTEAAAAVHGRETDVAIVCGRLRERDPEASIYNRLASLEWSLLAPAGEVEMCGGVAMVRTAAFAAVGGFDEALMAGEEPDLCYRLRAAGWRLLGIAAPMATHDAAMTLFSQWWKRNVRYGHGLVQIARTFRRRGQRLWERELRSALFWGACMPVCGVALTVVSGGVGSGVFVAYPLLAARIAVRTHRRGFSAEDAALYAVSCVLGKLPVALGAVHELAQGLAGRTSPLVEYKSSLARS
jgi:GT2 family glycosyltransferase